MGTDFEQAAWRSHRAATVLRDLGQLQSADDLGGIAVECALKAILDALGFFPATTGSTKPPARFAVHLPYIWDEFSASMGLRVEGRLLSDLPPSNPFGDWAIDDRYAADWVLSSASEPARASSLRAVMAMLESAWLDGVLP